MILEQIVKDILEEEYDRIRNKFWAIINLMNSETLRSLSSNTTLHIKEKRSPKVKKFYIT